MATRNIYKQLAGMEDLLTGKGTVSQSRGGSAVTISRVDVPFAIESKEALQALDVNLYTHARLYGTDGEYVEYIFDPNATTGISSGVGPGSWVIKTSSVLSFEFATFSALATGNSLQGKLQPEDIAHLYTKGLRLRTIVNNTTSNAGGAEYKLLTTAEKDASEYAGTEGYACIEINGSGYWACLQYTKNTNAEQFGAAGNGVTDDTIPVQLFINHSNIVNFNGNKFYYITQQTTKTINWDGGVHNVCLLIEDDNKIVNCNGATFIYDLADGDLRNAFYVDNVDNVEIRNPVFKPNNTLTAKPTLYRGISIVVTQSSNTLVYKSKTYNGAGNSILFQCSDSYIRYSRSLNENQWSSMHFASLSGINTEIERCVCFFATSDGDIGIFGSGENNSVVKCKLFNYAYSDATKTPTFLIGQGIFVDSGSDNTLIDGNYVRGYYYGIDDKTNTFATKIVNNTLYRNKISIASRLGEGNDRTILPTIENNTIMPSIGNGHTGVIFGTYREVGLYLENYVGGGKIANNTFSSKPTSAGEATKYIGIYGKWDITDSEGYSGITDITNNTFEFESRLGTQNSVNRAPAIILRGSSSIWYRNVTIKGNSFDVPADTTESYNLIDLQYVLNCSISGSNTFTQFAAGQLIKVSDSIDVSIDNNVMSRTVGFVDADDVTGLSISNNKRIGATTGFSTLISCTNCTSVNIDGNKYRANAGSNDGRFLSFNTGDGLMLTNNQVQLDVRTAADWYSVDGVNVDIASLTNKLEANNLVTNI